MRRLSMLEAGLARFDPDEIAVMSEPCRPKVLIVTESSLDFMATSGLGLSRFLHGILVGSGVTNKPIITLAYRDKEHPEKTVTINGDKFEVNCSFNFATAIPHVCIAEYDQIWLFGYVGASLGHEEIAVISDFMNSGGGVFATGDHQNLGLAMCGSLPRIRYMRDWCTKPLGNEEKIADAVERIDTVVNPGADNLFDFNDQSDDIPQRIYPKYTVVPRGVGGVGWKATVHPLLGPRGDRTTAADFQKDIDVLPDHPHESVCLEVTPATTLLCEGKEIKVIEETYKMGCGLSFVEFPFSAREPTKRVEADFVAFAVSGGRAIHEGLDTTPSKPPVRPQMFGVISAYNGHDAQPYEAGGPNPGRIVCDSSFHHFVNINLDGTASGCVGCDGLGKWSGTKPGDGTFTPSPDLERIFGYYRNTIEWLMPANRVVCGFWWTLVAARYHPYLLEELIRASEIKTWREFVGLGLTAAKVINLSLGSQTLRDKILGILRSERNEGAMKLMDLLDGSGVAPTFIDPDELLYGIVGCMLARTAVALSETDSLKTALDSLKTGAEKMIRKLIDEVTPLLQSAITEQVNLAEEALKVVKEMLVKLV